MSDPTPSRLVPDDLLPAARLISSKKDGDNYGGWGSFKQGRGSLCYGNRDVQLDEMRQRAKHHAHLAAAYEELAEWLAYGDDEDGNRRDEDAEWEP
ncbi:hypothetical protein ACFYVR_15895 [Rhodococcus sp. NPDC003318]|uniref:hypothetical protein n=1 Tax=Rhodococcus sp. NPDC003318 TaxID=3364503 RepID=UPI0036B1C9BF